MQFLLSQFKRREWTANCADPTQVIEWKAKRGHLVMLASWGVEAKLTVFGRTWRTYDNRFFKALFGLLEDAYWTREAECDEDPLGRLEDYR